MARKPLIKLKGQVEIKDGVSMPDVSDAVKKANAALAEVGTGTLKITVARGEFSA
jgi:hypothetical protein